MTESLPDRDARDVLSALEGEKAIEDRQKARSIAKRIRILYEELADQDLPDEFIRTVLQEFARAEFTRPQDAILIPRDIPIIPSNTFPTLPITITPGSPPSPSVVTIQSGVRTDARV